jgi:lambda family phage minor tail protein L
MAVDKISKDIQLLEQDAMIEMFVLDTRGEFISQSDFMAQGSDVLYFHNGVNKINAELVWQGQNYIPIPIEATGFDLTTTGSLPRPRVKLANPDGIFSFILKDTRDLVGAKVIRKRTFLKYLDAINFEDGINASADPNQFFPDDVYYIEQKIMENRYVIEWELAAAYDLSDVFLPKRQVIKDSCSWRYKQVDCGYSGALMFKADDTVTTNSAEDVCGKRLASCRARFGTGVLPFGGFPGTRRHD